MRSILAFGSLLAFLLASLATPALAAPDYPGGPDIIVDDDLRCPRAQFSQIQSAINAATPGTKIRVCPGRYDEQLLITVPLKLVAKPLGQAVIHGSIKVQGADDVRIEGFDIDSSGNAVGITVEGETERVDVRTNRVQHASSAGIEIFESSDAIVRDNTLINNTGIGLRLLEAFRTQAKHNTTSHNGTDGIAVFEGAGNRVDSNTSNSNGRNGVNVCFDTRQNLIENTKARGNAAAGIAVCHDGATETQLKKNTLQQNGIDASDQSTGMGTAGTNSIWTKNKCASSDPAGLCRNS
jgi:parallel beta-helix repeat protein